MKLLLIAVILIFAIGVAMALMTRLLRLQQKLAQLHDDLAQNDRQLQAHRLNLEKIAAQHDAKDAPKPENSI